MVKGVSRQVVVVHSPDRKLYEQAIFILREDAPDVSNDMLLREAMQTAGKPRKRLPGPVWACFGGGVIGVLWLLTVLL